MLCESISEIVFLVQGHLQGLTLWSFYWFIFNFTFPLLFCFNGLRHISLQAQLHTSMHAIWWWYKLYCVLQVFPRATQPHVVALMSASGPAGAWEIASTRIPPFIFKPNEHRFSGDGLRWVAAFTRITVYWLSGYASVGSDLLVAKPFS